MKPHRCSGLAVVAVGADIIELRTTAIGLGQGSELDSVLAALAAGKSRNGRIGSTRSLPCLPARFRDFGGHAGTRAHPCDL
jgi:hypothetical protein